MAESQLGDRSRLPRADVILGGAIGLVGVLVIVLVLMLASGIRLHNNTLGTIAAARGARDEMLTMSQAIADAESARRLTLQSNGRRGGAEFDAASEEARAHAAALRRFVGDDAEMDRLTLRIGELVETELSEAEANVATRAQLRAATAALRDVLNRHNDRARAAEQRAREWLEGVAMALAFLSLAASALAILVLRRERGQWRVANAMAEKARARAAASDLAKTRFLAAASHDMRQPLHALTLYLSALDKRVEGEEARGILGKAERAAQSLSGMFATLLDLARIRAGVIKPDMGPVALQEVFDSAAGEHPGANIEVVATTVTVRTDALLLLQLLRNLIANARKHGGGRVRIEARAKEGWAEICVRDFGPGIAARDQGRIFEEFVRLGGQGEGLGLGLAIVSHIARLLGHDLTLVSAPGEGARFSVRAPIVAARAEGAVPANQPASLNGLDVLVLDDDPQALEAIADALRDQGANVHACASEAEIDAALAEGATPRLLVMDLRINGDLAGVAIAKRVRASLQPPPPVIIVTGDTAPETLTMLRASGFNWLIKPVDPHALAAAASASNELRT